MSLKEAENIITMVEKVLKSVTPRNEYEANNMYLTNMERLAQARRCLNDFTGAYPQSILERIGNLELKVKEKQTSFSVKAQHDAFALDFEYSFDKSNNINAKTKTQNEQLLDGKLTRSDEINDEDDFTKELAMSAANKKSGSNKNTSEKSSNKKGLKNNVKNKNNNNNNNSNNSSTNISNTKKKSTKNVSKIDSANSIDTNLKTFTVEEEVAAENVKKVNSHNEESKKNEKTKYVIRETKDAQQRESNEELEEKIVRQDIEVEFSAIPPAILTKGGTCVEIANSPLICIRFTEPIVIETSMDDMLCNCQIEVYKCIWLALAWSCPVSTKEVREPQQEIKKLVYTESAEICQQKESDKCECTESNLFNAVKEEEGIFTQQNVCTENDDADCANVGGREDDTDACESNTYSQQLLDKRNNVDILSEELIAKYDATVEANLVYERDRHFPQVISALQAHRLREIKEKGLWVILLCHGGCFAGGVFKNGKCIVHKAFQRYVIRKKQGGKQSNFGDSSTFHSAGSMIRSAQELKWKIDVRAILLSWRIYINEADIILYAAPGPQNRTILTDFSQLPPLTSVPKNAANSPVNLSDKRVWGIPMTTHKPSFNELERIYDTLTHINVIYTKCEK